MRDFKRDLMEDRATRIKFKYGLIKKDIEFLSSYIGFLKSSERDISMRSRYENVLKSIFYKEYLEQMIHNLSGDTYAGSKNNPSYISYCRKTGLNENYGISSGAIRSSFHDLYKDTVDFYEGK